MMLSTPLSEEAVRSLRAGDVVFLSGTIVTGRDEMHHRALEAFEKGEGLPIDLEGKALYHCGPIMAKENDGWKLLAAGPTTSARMDPVEGEFIRLTGVRAIIGKGGMSAEVGEAMRECGCVYLSATGGAAVSAADGLGKVLGVEWLDLGMPEAMWCLEARNFGPLVVGMDAQGGSVYEDIKKRVKERLPEVRRRLGLE